MEEARFGNNLIMAIFIVVIVVLALFLSSLVFKLTRDTKDVKEDFNSKELNEVSRNLESNEITNIESEFPKIDGETIIIPDV